MRDAVIFYLLIRCGNSTGISFIGATALKFCRNLRIPSHSIFSTAARDKSSIRRRYGFKVHLAINALVEILGFYIMAANIDERKSAGWMT